MIFVVIVTAAAVVVGAIVPALIAQALGWAGYGAPFYLVVWLTGSAVAGLAALSQLLIPDRRGTALDLREIDVRLRETAAAERETVMTEREARHRSSDERLSDLTATIRERAAELDATRRDLDARASALYQAEASHKAAASDLAERMALFEMAQAQAAILEARGRLDDERAAIRDERAALTGERIALNAAQTTHATRVREHAAAVRAGKRTPAPKRAAARQGA